MSEHAELVAGLREYPVCGCNGCWNALQWAADAIEALLGRMARLEAVDEAVRKWEAGEEAEWVVVRAALDAAENANLT